MELEIADDEGTLRIVDSSNSDATRPTSSCSSNPPTPGCSSWYNACSSTFTTDARPTTLCSSNSPTPVSWCSSASGPKTDKKRIKTRKISEFMDKLENEDEQRINGALASFIFGCNLPLALVESVHFKNFIKIIRPAYAAKIPSRKTLSTTLLDKAYKKCIISSKNSLKSDSVLVIDGWKNSSSNAKTVVTTLHTADGDRAFLDAWDLSGESENAERLSEIIYESIALAKDKYDTDVFAVVSDNASTMIKMGKLTKHAVWHSTCSSHTGNLLAKDILDTALTDKVTMILKEFKHPDFEKQIVDKGGRRIQLPCETRWCSYRDSYTCLIKNLPAMKTIAATETCKKLKQTVKQLIFDENFINGVAANIEIFDPICKLINTSQNIDCSVADATDLWLNLDLPSKFQAQLDHRRNMFLNVYALTAYYLHPNYDESKLSQQQKERIFEFLFRNLDGQGIEDWDSFRNKSGFFKMLCEKNIEKPNVFWNMAEFKHPGLAKLAKKLLLLPASSAQIERIFSNWGYIHTPIRNRLSFERSKKLTHIFYSLKISCENEQNDYENEF